MTDYQFSPSERGAIGAAGQLAMATLQTLDSTVETCGLEIQFPGPERQLTVRVERGSDLIDVTIREGSRIISHGPWQASEFGLDTTEAHSDDG